MHVSFLLSGPLGDTRLSAEELERPFLISPVEQHPFLTLKDYFEALQEFIMRDGAKNLLVALGKMNPQDAFNPAAISEILIRSEKHGAFYHIASVEISGPGDNLKFALTTALSAPARNSLQEEYEILHKLSAITPDFLPALYCRETLTRQTGKGTAQFLMVAGEWLDGYHEWHACTVPMSAKQKIQLWDYEKGCRFLSDAESRELLRQAAYILTNYYDQTSFRQIYPWHHGAGDFVFKPEPGAFSVKLITARQYEPLVYFAGEEEADRLVAAIHFLLNLSLRIRIDRLEGVGAPAWLEEFSVQAAVEGFFAGLCAAAGTNRLMVGSVADFLEIMRSFTAREILDMYESLLQVYAEADQEDFRLIQARLPDHAAQLHEALQQFSLQYP